VLLFLAIMYGFHSKRNLLLRAAFVVAANAPTTSVYPCCIDRAAACALDASAVVG